MSKVFGFCWNVYLISALIAASIFNWQYARQHGFISWLFFGEVVATAKATVWPYFVLQSSARQPDTQATKMAELLVLVGNASRFANALDVNSAPEEAQQKVATYRRQILEKSKEIDFDVIDRIYPALGTMFSSTVIKSIQTVEQEGLDGASRVEDLWPKWVAWFNPRRPDIVAALRKAAGG